jgi:hypothetical protein
MHSAASALQRAAGRGRCGQASNKSDCQQRRDFSAIRSVPTEAIVPAPPL